MHFIFVAILKPGERYDEENGILSLFEYIKMNPIRNRNVTAHCFPRPQPIRLGLGVR
jgi:hypothetical protein